MLLVAKNEKKWQRKLRGKFNTERNVDNRVIWDGYRGEGGEKGRWRDELSDVFTRSVGIRLPGMNYRPLKLEWTKKYNLNDSLTMCMNNIAPNEVTEGKLVMKPQLETVLRKVHVGNLTTKAQKL